MPASHYACQSPLSKVVLILRRACGVIFERQSEGEHRHQRTGAAKYSRLPPWCWRSLHRAEASGADRRRVCPALVTFLRSLDLSLELIVLAPRTLTAKQVRHCGK